ncbi:MAG TPA: BTAD domain-containing putative transcriptional regulator [Pilimelia sp.]|nr:BTAD domain-containing putative transcriptional regulator [Pilimelia sp.]
MWARVLGTIEVLDGRDWTSVRPGKPRALLAILLLHRDCVLGRDWLIDSLWDGQPPASATRILPHYVWQLRSLLPGEGDDRYRLESAPNGYRLAVPADAVDHEVFTGLAQQGRQAAAAGDPAEAARLLTAALRLWRGPALFDVRTVGVLAGAAARLDLSRLDATEELAAAQLECGRHADAVAAAEELTATEPYRQRAWELLMLGLHRAGRRPDALAAYQRLRRRWVDDLGVEPGWELQELHRRLLADDPYLAYEMDLSPGREPAAAEPADRPPARAVVAPAQLPPDLADFTGRDGAVAELIRVLSRDAGTGSSGVVPGAVVYGQGGIGKTALAVRAGHRLRDAFPGGQLFVDLQGVQRRPLDPRRVLANFLRALGVSSSAIPDTTEERMDLFRSAVADRRVLVILDNAADEAQVRPLLPGAGCSVLITSRRPLPGLAGFAWLRLDMLGAAEARELLARIVGCDRVGAEAGAADRIAGLCCGLPLAVRAAGARLAVRPHWPLARLAARLADEHRRLDELSAGDLEVRASLALSHAGLDAGERQALHAVALAPAGDVATWLVAAMCDVDDAAAGDLVERLVDAQLLNPAGTDAAGQSRYRMHDLTRVFALERRAVDEPDTPRGQVVGRGLDACVALTRYAVDAAGDRVRGFVADPPEASRARYAGTLAVIDNDPFAWYAAERVTLVAAVDSGDGNGSAASRWRLAHALAMFFEVCGAWDDWRQTHEVALGIARRGGDRAGEAALLSGLGRLELDRGRNEQAVANLVPAVDLARSLPCPALLAQTLQRLGQAIQSSGGGQEAAGYHREALGLARSLGDHVVESEVERDLGRIHQQMGQLAEAAGHFERALAAAEAADSRHPQPWILASLGFVHLDTGRSRAAATCFERAMTAAEGLGDRRCFVYALRGLGDASRQAGDSHAARDLFHRALVIARELGEDLGEVQALRRLGTAYSDLGQHDQAYACLTRAAEIVAAVGHSRVEGEVLLALGTARVRAGRCDEAAPILERSIAIFRRLDAVLLLRRAEEQLGLVSTVSHPQPLPEPG